MTSCSRTPADRTRKHGKKGATKHCRLPAPSCGEPALLAACTQHHNCSLRILWEACTANSLRHLVGSLYCRQPAPNTTSAACTQHHQCSLHSTTPVQPAPNTTTAACTQHCQCSLHPTPPVKPAPDITTAACAVLWAACTTCSLHRTPPLQPAPSCGQLVLQAGCTGHDHCSLRLLWAAYTTGSVHRTPPLQPAPSCGQHVLQAACTGHHHCSLRRLVGSMYYRRPAQDITTAACAVSFRACIFDVRQHPLA